MFSAEMPDPGSVSFSTWMAAPALRKTRNPSGSGPLGREFSPRFKGSASSPATPLPGTIGPNQYHRGPGGQQKWTDIGGQIVDDSPCLRFFLEPTDTLHLRYEVLRAF